MKIILLKDIKGIGKKFEEKNASDGYAINYLIPNKLAVMAGSAAAGQIKSLKEAEEKQNQVKNQKISENVSKLAGTEISVELKANEKGHLFASLSKEKIVDLLKEKGIQINSENLNTDPIKEIGTFTIPVLVGGKETHFTLVVSSK
jgi:large subunit ribosomal protein L9